MLNRLSRALLAATVLVLAGAALTNAWSKPADLPLNIKETCVPQCLDPVAPTVTLLGVEDAQIGYVPPFNDSPHEQLNQYPGQKQSPSREDLDAKIEELIEKLTSLICELKGYSQAQTGNTPDAAILGNQLGLLRFAFSEDYRRTNAEWREIWLKEPRIDLGISVFPSLSARQPSELPTVVLATDAQFGKPQNLVLSGQTLFSGMPAKNEIKQVMATSIMFGASVNSDPGLLGNPVLAEREWQRQVMSAEAFKSHQARHFYEIAELCEQHGDFEMARNCYEEASRVSPQSTFGVLASNLLAKMDIAAVERNVLSGTEVQEVIPVVKKEIVHDAKMDPRRLVESWRMLQLGEGYRLAGDLNNAFRCFQDSYAICPASRYGQAAMDRMIEVERVRSEQRPQQERRPRADGMDDQQLQVIRRPAYSELELQQRERAHELFVLGENDLREGDLRAAYGRYQETHLAFPDSFFGMRAIERMQEIESRRK